MEGLLHSNDVTNWKKLKISKLRLQPNKHFKCTSLKKKTGFDHNDNH
jgi:hypothetical protein